MRKNTFLYPTFLTGILCLWGMNFSFNVRAMDYKDLESCDELTEFVVIAQETNELPPRYASNQLEDELIRFFDSFTLIGKKSNENNNTHKRNSW